MASGNIRPHGGVRGADAPGRSLQFEGRFGRIFRSLPPAVFSEGALKQLGAKMTSPAEDKPTPETEVDAEENQGISAGYTYLGQFIDHDLTFDPASSLMQQDDPDALVDFRTPRFDLDNVYGRGPDDQPYMYEADGRHMQLGRLLVGNPSDPNTKDLPRHKSLGGGNARALIGDPRNDENVIVSQLQGLMLRFHNRLADESPSFSFQELQRVVRWHYQYVVLHDFLPTIVGPDIVFSILPHLRSGKSIFADPPILNFYKWRNAPFIPIEFTAAAYRFGHSMVRPIYRLNTTLGKDPPPNDDPANGRIVIFDPQGDDKSLTGFREFPSTWAIDWSLFFDMGNNPPQLGVKRLQRAYKIDTSLVNPLGKLPPSIAPDPPPSLAQRNLLRGFRMGLPSGQDVARVMGLPVLPDDKLVVGKATSDDPPEAKSIVDVSQEFAGKAPLWYYVLAEAQQQFDGNNATPIRLGPLGGRIVAETIIGLILGDSHSFLSQDPAWRPMQDKFGIADLIKAAIGK
jgi:Animal haem peroxidase